MNSVDGVIEIFCNIRLCGVLCVKPVVRIITVCILVAKKDYGSILIYY